MLKLVAKRLEPPSLAVFLERDTYYRIHGTKGYFERVDGEVRFYSRELYTDSELTTLPVARMRPELRSEAQGAGAHGGADYALMKAFLNAIRTNSKSPVSLREGLRMSLPGVYAAESARRGGELLRIRYPWLEIEEE